MKKLDQHQPTGSHRSSEVLRGGRADRQLPVSLVPTAMAAEMRNGLQAVTLPSAGAGGNSVKTVPRAETAELIGQGELPLRGAVAAATAAAARGGGSDDEANKRAAGADGQPFVATPSVQDEIRERLAGYDCLRVLRTGKLELGPSEASSPHPISPRAAEVAIEDRVVPGRTGRPKVAEDYPFGALTPVSVNEKRELTGPSFLIPAEDNAENQIAAAHKRHPSKRFITRKVRGGTMIWRRS